MRMAYINMGPRARKKNNYSILEAHNENTNNHQP
jgi:hypothetical protein